MNDCQFWLSSKDGTLIFYVYVGLADFLGVNIFYCDMGSFRKKKLGV